MLLTRALLLQGIGGFAMGLAILYCLFNLFECFADSVARKVIQRLDARTRTAQHPAIRKAA
jgi:hypothetical protein